MVVAAFKAAAAAAGMPEETNITGHSCRVTGAQRMALADLSEWRIQVFGRWGSSAVLKYIRETFIDAEATNIAAEVEAAARVPVRAIVEQAPPAEVPVQVIDEALEAMRSEAGLSAAAEG